MLAPCKNKLRISLTALAAVCAALTGAFFAAHVAYAQGSDNDYVDVAVILEAPDDQSTTTRLNLNIVVVNHGARTAYDVEVVVDVVYPGASSHFDSVPEVPVGSSSLENSKYRLRWTIPELGGLQREEVTVESRIYDNVDMTFDKRAYTHEFFGTVTTSSFDSNPGNNTSRVWSVPYLHISLSSHIGAKGNYTVAVAVDEPSPLTGDTVNFTITTAKKGGQGRLPIDLQVAIELTDGLTVSGAPSYVSTDTGGTVVTKPSSVSYDSGVFTIGTLQYTSPNAFFNSVTLPITVASDAVVNEQCLTATLTGNPPPGNGPDDDDISDNVAKLCLLSRTSPPPYFNSADLQEFVTHPCVGDTNPPCGSTDDVRVRAIYTAVDPPVTLGPGTPVILVPDTSETRKYVAETDGVNAEHIVSWQVPVQISADPFTSEHVRWTDYTASFSYEMPGKADFDKLHIFGIGLKALLNNGQRQATFLAAYDPGNANNGPFDLTAEFENLGTYKVQHSTTATHDNNTPSDTNDDVVYSAEGSYIFYVGPMVELAVEDGGASPHAPADQHALTIVAVTNGPDEPPGGATVTGLPTNAEVIHVSHGSYRTTGEWNIDRLRPRDYYRSRGESEPTLVLGASAGDTASVSIASAKNYEVCVGPKSNPGNLAHTTQATCEAVTNASWNSTPVYDYNADNNAAIITARAGTGGGEHAPASLAVMETRVGNIVLWRGVEEVNSLEVTHYEVQRWANPWTPLAGNVTGTVYLDRQGRSNADYRARAVNAAGVPGPWSITGRPPGAPRNFSVALSESGNAAVLSWTAPASPSPITGYVIDISDSASGDSRTNDVTVGGSVTSWTHTGLSGGDVKFYRVQARNRDGVGAWTAWQSVSAGPGAPGNLRARANGPREIVLTWSAASSRDVPIYEYELEYSDTSASEGYEWNFLQTVLHDEGLRYVDNTVPYGTTRYYRVRARTLQGNVAGTWSNIASATTAAAGPSAPLNVSVGFVVGNTENGALLTWEAPASGNASYYRIEHSTDGQTWESESARHAATCNVGGTTKFCYTDSGLFSGTEHWYRVAGVNSSGVAGEWSEPVSHITQGDPTEAPGEPQNLRIASVNGRQVSLAWDEPEDDGGSRVTGYEYRVDGACLHDPQLICQVIKPTRTGGTSVTVTVPDVRGQYEFYVRALNAVGAGWWTQPVRQYVDPQRNWRVTLSPSSLRVDEGGEATYRVRLTSDPGQPVWVALDWSGDPDLGNTLSYQQFKWLLPSNYANENPDLHLDPDFTSPWNVGVPITVTAEEDDDSENGTAAIHNTIYYVPCADLGYPAGCVDDPEDTGVNVCLTATERDNEPNPVNSPDVTCQNSSFNMANVRANIRADVRATEAGRSYSVSRRASVVEGGSAALTLTLAEAAPAGGVEFTVAADYGQDATATAEDVGAIVSPVTVPEGDATLEIAIPTVDDDVDEDDETFLVTVIAATPGWLAEPGDDTATVTVEDDDTAGFTVNAADPLTVREGEGATYTVALDSRPTADVTIEAVVDDDSKVVVSPVSETFTPDNWSLPVTFSVNALSDDDTGDESVVISHALTSDDPRYAVLQVSAVSVSVTDTTAPGQQRANSAPTVSAAIDDVTIVSESGTRQVSLSGVFADADDDDLSVTTSSSDENVTVAGVSADQSTLSLLAKARGTAAVTVTAADGHGGEVADEFTVTVKAAPVVASAIDDVSELEAGATHDVSLSGVFSDADGDALTITAASSDEAVATVAVAADQSSLTVTGVSGGTAAITVTAEDADGNTVIDDFDVSVAAQQQETSNQVPTVSSAIADVTIVNESGTEQVSLSGVFSDAESDALTITAASSDESIATVAVASDQSALTVTAKARGTATVTVTARDGSGGMVEDAFSVRVKAAPTVASALGDVSGMPAETVREVSLSGVFSDADGDTLTLTAETSDFEVVEVFVGTPGDEDNLFLLAVAEGSVTITVTAEDADGNTVSDTFDVSVTAEEEPEDGQAGQ